MRAAPLARAALAVLLVGAQAAFVPAGRAAVFDDDIARARIQELRERFEAYQKTMNERLSRIEAASGDRRAILDLAGQIDAMRADLARMRGQVEVLLHQLEGAEKRQKDLYVDVDTRLRKLEQVKEAAAAAPGGKPAPDAGSVPEAETRAYEAALNQFKLGNYPLAISAFQGFLVTYPSSKLAPSAQYWIGNAHYAQRDYKQAIAAQQRVLSAWPEDAKAPDAMLNIASSQEAMGDRRGAQKTLEALVARYPQSPAAASARQRLAPPAAAAPGKR
jgi:tol-pal system protein YbgF